MQERSRELTLPDELVLLFHKANGSYYVTTNPTQTASAAEIGELALQHRVQVQGTKLKLIDSRPSHVAWIDELLTLLRKKAGPKNKPIALSSCVAARSSAFKEHRTILTELGMLTRQPKKFLGLIPDDRYFPDELIRDGIASELGQVARVERAIDNRLALLAALAHGAGLDRPLGFDKSERAMLKSIARGENLGSAVESVVAATGAAIAAGAVFAPAAGGDGGGAAGGGG